VPVLVKLEGPVEGPLLAMVRGRVTDQSYVPLGLLVGPALQGVELMLLY
jgi:hypothetical protein